MRNDYVVPSFILFVLVGLLLGGCSGSDGLTINCETFEDNFEQAAETTVATGEEITVTLCVLSNRGYHWTEEATIDNPAVVEQLSYEYVPDRSPMGGIPGKEVWVFRALEPGTTTISLEHTQPSGLNRQGVWTYQLTVTVNPAGGTDEP
jgi:predicted secreted protein